jgi:hypothetical protein
MIAMSRMKKKKIKKIIPYYLHIILLILNIELN